MIHPQQTRLLTILDRERQDVESSGRIRVGSVVREIGRSGSSDIAYSSHEEADLESAVRREIDYFNSIGHDFEWKTYSHDQPQPLDSRLQALGFDMEAEEAVLVAETEVILHGEDPGHDVRPITTAEGIADYMQVRRQAFAQKSEGYGDWLAEQLRETPELIDLCVAYVDDMPVGSARTGYDSRSQFSSLCSGGVTEAFRGRGIYRSMVIHRARAVAERGIRWLKVDALPTSRPVLERMGFMTITTTRPCLWSRSRDALVEADE